MENISILAQLIVALSVIIVWVFRYENIVLEFKQYGLSSLVRNAVGASKIALATVLILGIWYQEFLVPASVLMAILMVDSRQHGYRDIIIQIQSSLITKTGEI